MLTYNASGSETGTYYYHSDRLGSLAALTDSSGAVSESHAYSPYGEELNAPPPQPAGNPYRYTGRRLDRETGLYYYRARYYAPALGRFLQTDPIGYGKSRDSHLIPTSVTLAGVLVATLHDTQL